MPRNAYQADKSQKGVKMVVPCPICGEELQRKGLYGHLRFKHELSGDKLTKAYHGNIEKQEKQQEKNEKQQDKRRPFDLACELHAELREVRKLLAEVEETDKSDWLSTDEAADKLKRFYKAEEKRIAKDIDALLVGTEGSEKVTKRAWDDP